MMFARRGGDSRFAGGVGSHGAAVNTAHPARGAHVRDVNRSRATMAGVDVYRGDQVSSIHAIDGSPVSVSKHSSYPHTPPGHR